MASFYRLTFTSTSSPSSSLFINQSRRRRKVHLALWLAAIFASTAIPTAFGFLPSPMHITTRTIFSPLRSSRFSPFSPPFRRIIYATPDPNFDELIQDDDDTAPMLVVPREPFVSEAEVAQQANDLIGAAASSSSSVVDLPQEIQNSFLQYALSIILGRALPDARDGLKPVHRRILYSMHQLQLLPTMPHRKCARVVGEVLGKYHPHGDMAVYDALVRMAQDFSTLYRLVDGHGNFGSIDNDPAAAMRYTECRLTHLATQTLLQELADDTVDFTANFDGNEIEPNVLPSKLPLLLLNGSSGIAVGMATNIPPHNVREVLQACMTILQRERIKGKSDVDDIREPLSDSELFQLIPGPDFPTGASILGTATSRRLYTTGNGGIVMRAITHVEPAVVGGTKRQLLRTAIVVTELPYQVNKAALLEQIAELVNDKKLEGIADLRDESDRHGIRVVIELKQSSIPQVVLNNLYQKTKLQTTFSGNLVALWKSNNNNNNNNKNIDSVTTVVPLTPQRFTLRQALDYFLDFRFGTIRRKTRHQFQKVQSRMHIVEGLLLALQQIDQVIDLIRTMPDTASCREALMLDQTSNNINNDNNRSGLQLGLSRDQADAVLRLQLGQLTRLNRDKLQLEKDELETQCIKLQTLLDDDNAVYQLMMEEFQDMDTKFGHDRKTRILQDDGEVNEIDLITNAQSVIVVTRGGYIKRMPLQTFENQRRGTRGKRGTSDSASVDVEVLHCITCNDHDTLLMITQNGIAFGISAYQVPSGSRTARGTPLPSVLPISIDDVVTTVLPVSEFSKNEYIVLATKLGWIKRTSLDVFEKTNSRGLVIATLEEGDKLQWCHRCTDHDDILLGSSHGKAVRFPASTLRPTGRTSRGVISMKLKEGDTIADMNVLAPTPIDGNGEEFVLCVTEQGYGKRVSTNDFPSTSRGKLGVIAMKFKKQSKEQDKMSCFCIVKEDDEILVNTSRGIMVRQKVQQIPCQSRSATGVVIQKVDESDSITSVSVLPMTAEDDE